MRVQQQQVEMLTIDIIQSTFAVENGTEQDSKWRRGCKNVSEPEDMKCETHDFGINGKVVIVEECVCDTDQCNRQLPYIPIKCVSCDENDPGCDAYAANELVVTCQMDHNDQPYYGNSCFIGHTGML